MAHALLFIVRSMGQYCKVTRPAVFPFLGRTRIVSPSICYFVQLLLSSCCTQKLLDPRGNTANFVVHVSLHAGSLSSPRSEDSVKADGLWRCNLRSASEIGPPSPEDTLNRKFRKFYLHVLIISLYLFLVLFTSFHVNAGLVSCFTFILM